MIAGLSRLSEFKIIADRTIRVKLFFLLMILFVVLGMSTAGGIFYLNKVKIGSKLYLTLKDYSLSFELALGAKANINETMALLLKMRDEQDKSALVLLNSRVKGALAAADESLSQIVEKAERINTGDVKTAVSEVWDSWSDYKKSVSKGILPVFASGDSQKANVLVSALQKREYEEFSKQLAGAIDIMKLKMLKLELQTQIGIKQVMVILVIATIILFGIILVFGLIIINSITKPIKTLVAAAGNLASRAGDLSQKISISTKDEVGSLASAFNQLIDSMRDMVSQVRGIADKVSSSAEELSSSSQEMNASTQEIANVIQQVSKGAVVQSERVEESFVVMGRSLESLKQVVISAQNASVAVEKTNSCADNGRKNVQEFRGKINHLTGTVLETAKVIQGLGEKSQAIGEITVTITSIADQTNLLALNAAIEAARAGEAGRGFAVVAEEVRKLAEGSAEAVKKIGDLVKSIQFGTGQAVIAIKASSKEAQDGQVQMAQIENNLIEINKAAQDVGKLVEQISSAGKDRVIEIERVVKTINEVAEIAKGSAATAEEVSSSTEEQTASMQEMSASAMELARLAVDLKDLVGKFKL